MIKTISGSLILLIVFFVVFLVLGRRKGDKRPDPNRKRDA